MDPIFVIILLAVSSILILVFLLRWIFRIDTIVHLLSEIRDLLKGERILGK